MKNKSALLSTMALLLATTMLFLFLGCSTDTEEEYVCKVMEWDVWSGSYEWARNTWVMATSEDDALSKCDKKVSNGYCSSCWKD